ncbi:MAG TPA: cupin domain-containing protein [Marmoricola sp.]|nr:cupin domain-containing protein [Marmoricola sp.]
MEDAMNQALTTVSLTEVVDELLAKAAASSSRREGRTVHGGREHALRQTLIALLAGEQMQEHESPGEATLQVLRGRVRLVVGPDSTELAAGDYLVIPPARHSLDAVEDSVALLTTSMPGHDH